MAQLSIPDNVYNWLVDFFQERSHCVRYSEDMSALLSITASIIQGSAVGPAAYVVQHTCDLVLEEGMRIGKGKCYTHAYAANAMPRLVEMEC